jgi:hypothetical protein
MTSTRLSSRPDTRPIWLGAVSIASFLTAVGIGLGFAGILPLSALAFLGGLAAAIAAVRERRRGAFGWLLVALAGAALVAVTVASYVSRP